MRRRDEEDELVISLLGNGWGVAPGRQGGAPDSEGEGREGLAALLILLPGRVQSGEVSWISYPGRWSGVHFFFIGDQQHQHRRQTHSHDWIPSRLAAVPRYLTRFCRPRKEEYKGYKIEWGESKVPVNQVKMSFFYFILPSVWVRV